MFGPANMDPRLRGDDGDFAGRSCFLLPVSFELQFLNPEP